MFEPIRLQSKASKYKKGLTHVKNTVTRNQKYTVQSQKPKRRNTQSTGKEFGIMTVMIIQNLRNRMKKIQEMFNKDLEERKNKQR